MAVSRINEAGLNVNQYGNRNLVINGGMQVWQRATSATAANNTYNTVDRFQIYEATGGAFTSEQSTGNSQNTGHENALECNVTTADTSIGATEYAAIVHRIEAQNLQHLQWGYASGKNLILSFWVKSNKTGIYSLSTEKNDATTYRRVNEFTIDAANTWEQKTIKIPALTNSNSGGTIANDANLGIKFEWCLAYGSTFTTSSLDQWLTTAHFASTNQVNWMDSTSNNFYLTGIQLEVGDTATDFEHRTFGDELAKCQRYFARSYDISTATGTATSVGAQASTAAVSQTYASAGTYTFPVEMRATPTVTLYSTANANTTGKVTADGTDGTGSASFISTNSVFILRSNDSGGVAANVIMKAHLTADAEL